MPYNKVTNVWEGYIYCITNKLNGKQYIGQTIATIERRWGEHLRKSKHNKANLYLYTAMNKYGLDNFAVNIVECINSDSKDSLINQLNHKEVELIARYNTLKPSGYNMTIGGCNLPNTWDAKAVYQYDVDCIFIAKYDSISDASKVTGIDQSDISNCCLGKLKSAGYYLWRTDNIPPEEGYASRKSRVKQFKLCGEFIKTWITIEEAGKSLNGETSIQYILNCCQGKAITHCNYVWRFYNDCFDKYLIPQYRKMILQYSKDMRLIKIYRNKKDIYKEHSIDKSGLSRNLKGKSKACGGYIWKYAS